MAAFDTTRPQYVATPVAGHVKSGIATLVARFNAWNDRRVTRNALNKLTNRELEDIGLSRADIDMIVARQ